MSYQSIDILQRSLASTIFSSKKDAKKAAGRAIGTIVEIITYYLLREWGFTTNIQIETKLPEYGNSEITHNVEFTLHRILHKEERIAIKPVTYARIKTLFDFKPQDAKAGSFIDKNDILKNSAVIGRADGSIAICNLLDNKLVLSFIREQASAMFECKRVGVEEGQKKVHKLLKKQNKVLMWH